MTMRFQILDEEVHLLCCRGSEAHVRIPDFHMSKPVTAIAASAFEGNVSLKTVEIPSTVHSIGANAFLGCSNLQLVSGHPYAHREYGVSCFWENIEIGEQAFCHTALSDVMFMGGNVAVHARAFSDCQQLANVVFSTDCIHVSLDDACFRQSGISSFYCPEHILLEKLPEEIFAHCENLKNVYFRAKEVMSNAFLDCVNLTALPLAEGLSQLISPAFSGCGLRKLHLPESLELVASNLLLGSRIEKITVSPKNPRYRSAANENLLIDTLLLSVVACTPATRDPVVIPNGVTRIAPEAFANTEISSLDLNGIHLICKRAFWNSRLKFLHLPRKVLCFDEAFANCSLKLLELHDILEESGKKVDFHNIFRNTTIDTIRYYGTYQDYKEKFIDSPQSSRAILYVQDQQGHFELASDLVKNLMYDYVDHRSHITLTRIAGRFPYLTLPDHIHGKPVIHLGSATIPECTQELIIPATFTHIDPEAFCRAKNLRKIHAPANLELPLQKIPDSCQIIRQE